MIIWWPVPVSCSFSRVLIASLLPISEIWKSMWKLRWIIHHSPVQDQQEQSKRSSISWTSLCKRCGWMDCVPRPSKQLQPTLVLCRLRHAEVGHFSLASFIASSHTSRLDWSGLRRRNSLRKQQMTESLKSECGQWQTVRTITNESVNNYLIMTEKCTRPKTLMSASRSGRFLILTPGAPRSISFVN